jgi:hypothetical protein
MDSAGICYLPRRGKTSAKSFFLYNVSRKGEEIYSMDEAQLRREESRGYRDLALEYLEK